MDLTDAQIIEPIRKLLIFTIPIGMMPSKEVPEYMQRVSSEVFARSRLPCFVERVFLPTREDTGGPKIHMIDLYEDDDLMTGEEVAALSRKLPLGEIAYNALPEHWRDPEDSKWYWRFWRWLTSWRITIWRKA